jgi:hypothetical protein
MICVVTYREIVAECMVCSPHAVSKDCEAGSVFDSSTCACNSGYAGDGYICTGNIVLLFLYVDFYTGTDSLDHSLQKMQRVCSN